MCDQDLEEDRKQVESYYNMNNISTNMTKFVWYKCKILCSTFSVVKI